MSFTVTEGIGARGRYEPPTLWALRYEILRLQTLQSFFQGTGDTPPLMLRIRMDTVQYGSRYGSRYGSSPVQYGSVPILFNTAQCGDEPRGGIFYFAAIFGQFGVPFCVVYDVCMHACMYMYV